MEQKSGKKFLNTQKFGTKVSHKRKEKVWNKKVSHKREVKVWNKRPVTKEKEKVWNKRSVTKVWNKSQSQKFGGENLERDDVRRQLRV